ncbi:MAG TPA: ankyrin repeat domain-containing protein [Blastocatellia bacterium]|nr:ankyrin repeat domain-containing protein [Blastocatellia bacterium]
MIANAALAQNSRTAATDTDDRTLSAEAQAYKQWYDTWLQKDYLRTTDAAIAYLQQYPDGKYADYLWKWIKNVSGSSLEKRSLSLDALVMALLDAGANVNMPLKDGKTLLMLAAIDGKPEIIRRLLERGADVNAQEETHQWTALTYTIWTGNEKGAEVLLEGGADINLKDKSGRGAFENAIATKNSNIIRLIKRAAGKD